MIAVGQELWFVPSYRYSKPHVVTVEKVGRKWIHVTGGHRLGTDDLIADGGQYSSPGRAWLTEQHWQAEQSRHGAWDELRKFVDARWRPPDGLSETNIRDAISLLKTAERTEP